MYASQLLRLCESDRFIKKTLVGVFANDTLPKVRKKLLYYTPRAYIVNSASSASLGEHWLLIYVKPYEKRVIFFDSFGKTPVYYSKRLAKWVKSWGYTVSLNPNVFQASRSHYCGLFVLFLLYFLSRHVPFNVIMKKFSSNPTRNDALVSRFAWQRFKFNTRKEIERAKTKNELYNKMRMDLYLIATKDYL